METSQPLLKVIVAPPDGEMLVFSGKTYSRLRIGGPRRPAVFIDCRFDRVRFEVIRRKESTLAGSEFRNCILENCDFGPATLDLRRVRFAESELRDVEFRLGRLSGADFTGARLKGVTFRGADLSEASFRDARLHRVSFERATLSGADFRGCRISQGNFWGEPPWEDAIVDDELRYSFGTIRNPIVTVRAILESGDPDPALQAFHDWLLGWAADSPEVPVSHSDVKTSSTCTRSSGS